MSKRKRLSTKCYPIIGIIIGLIVYKCVHHKLIQPTIQVNFGFSTNNNIKSTEVNKLYDNVRVFCYILTGSAFHEKRAKHVKATWAKRCNKYVFMSSVVDPDLPSIDLNVPEGREYLWEKTKAAFKYIYDNHLNDYDWFLKADDDTYVVLENLRSFVKDYSTNESLYFGYKFRTPQFPNQIYPSGGSGYILSRKAVTDLIEKALPNKKMCPNTTIYEDFELGRCMNNVGAKLVATNDKDMKPRSLPLGIEAHLDRDYYVEWFDNYSVIPLNRGHDCCSDTMITTHYTSPQLMYFLDYLIYNLTTGFH